jgi:hypothetical protein
MENNQIHRRNSLNQHLNQDKQRTNEKRVFQCDVNAGKAEGKVRQNHRNERNELKQHKKTF